MSASDRWKYSITTIKAGIWGGVGEQPLQEALERMGNQGWELVQVLREGGAAGNVQLVFKRPG